MTLSPITVVLTGLSVLLVGGVWAATALLGRGKGGWRTALVLAGGFAAAAAGLREVDGSLALASLALSAASLLFAALRTDLPRWLAKASALPLAQAGSLALLGLATVCYGLHRIDADLQHDLNESAKIMDAAASTVDLGPSSAPAARTDRGRPVPLWVPESASVEDLQTFSEADYIKRMRFEAHLIQTGPLDGDYNCHGWVFTGGKFWVRGGSVDAILTDNGYRETKKPTIGDVCVYRDDRGEVSHTAVVRGQGADGLILLESKWGKLGRYIHTASEHHAYIGHTPSYYRTKRGSHLLAGVQNAQPEVFAGAAEEE